MNLWALLIESLSILGVFGGLFSLFLGGWGVGEPHVTTPLQIHTTAAAGFKRSQCGRPAGPEPGELNRTETKPGRRA